MPLVLGIDAAWTETNPTGVALARKDSSGWNLLRVAASYSSYLGTNRVDQVRPSGGTPDVKALLATSQTLGGSPVSIVAIDMPLSRLPITGRRASDNAISKIYGGRHASTHSPNAVRPGNLSTQITADFSLAGYPLQTRNPVVGGLIEVYPHPAIIELCALPIRSPYKYGNRSKYWPDQPTTDRKRNIIGEWRMIETRLGQIFSNLGTILPTFTDINAPGWRWKAQEDMLDAIICVAVGIWALEGSAVPYGDSNSAIWVPQPRDFDALMSDPTLAEDRDGAMTTIIPLVRDRAAAPISPLAGEKAKSAS